MEDDEVRPYKCPHCSKGFNFANSLRLHKRKLHKDYSTTLGVLKGKDKSDSEKEEESSTSEEDMSAPTPQTEKTVKKDGSNVIGLVCSNLVPHNIDEAPRTPSPVGSPTVGLDKEQKWASALRRRKQIFYKVGNTPGKDKSSSEKEESPSSQKGRMSVRPPQKDDTLDKKESNVIGLSVSVPLHLLPHNNDVAPASPPPVESSTGIGTRLRATPTRQFTPRKYVKKPISVDYKVKKANDDVRKAKKVYDPDEFKPKYPRLPSLRRNIQMPRWLANDDVVTCFTGVNRDDDNSSYSSTLPTLTTANESQDKSSTAASPKSKEDPGNGKKSDQEEVSPPLPPPSQLEGEEDRTSLEVTETNKPEKEGDNAITVAEKESKTKKDPVKKVVKKDPAKKVVKKEPVKKAVKKDPIKKVVKEESVKIIEMNPVEKVIEHDPIKTIIIKVAVKKVVKKDPVKKAVKKDPVKKAVKKDPVKKVVKKDPVEMVIDKDPFEKVIEKEPVKKDTVEKVIEKDLVEKVTKKEAVKKIVKKVIKKEAVKKVKKVVVKKVPKTEPKKKRVPITAGAAVENIPQPVNELDEANDPAEVGEPAIANEPFSPTLQLRSQISTLNLNEGRDVRQAPPPNVAVVPENSRNRPSRESSRSPRGSSDVKTPKRKLSPDMADVAFEPKKRNRGNSSSPKTTKKATSKASTSKNPLNDAEIHESESGLDAEAKTMNLLKSNKTNQNEKSLLAYTFGASGGIEPLKLENKVASSPPFLFHFFTRPLTFADLANGTATAPRLEEASFGAITENDAVAERSAVKPENQYRQEEGVNDLKSRNQTYECVPGLNSEASSAAGSRSVSTIDLVTSTDGSANSSQAVSVISIHSTPSIESIDVANLGELPLIEDEEDDIGMNRDRSGSLSVSCGSESLSEKIKSLDDTETASEGSNKNDKSDDDDNSEDDQEEDGLDADSFDSLMSEFSDMVVQASEDDDGVKLKEECIRFLTTKVSANAMWRIRQELKRLKKDNNYFKFGKLCPFAAGLMHDIFCQSLD